MVLAQTTWYVDKTGNDSNAGSSSEPFLTIGKAISSANATVIDEIIVRPGTYQENLDIDKNVRLYSSAGRSQTTIEGSNSSSLLGTIHIKTGSDGVIIGDINQGFKIVGIDGPAAIEKAAVYLQGTHTNMMIRGNEIVADGDAGLMAEYNANVTYVTIDKNFFSGQTFTGSNPAGDGFDYQFTLSNVPRQLVVFGGGSTGTNTQYITFTDNIINGMAGGYNTSNLEQGNTLVTIDADNSIITGNSFEGVTTRYASSLRTRRPNTSISGNDFVSTGLTPTTMHLYIDNMTIIPSLIDANSFDKGVYVIGGNAVGLSIQAAIDAASANDEIHVAAGTYIEAVSITKALTLRGATWNVNKNGYTVPGNYAWDPNSETIITHPNPSTGYDAIVDIYDVDGVTIEGFIVQELNAESNKNSSLVRVRAQTKPITVTIRNNVIGPNTNTTYQDGTHGRMGLYLVNNPYSDQYGIVNSIIAGNKIFGCEGNGNNIFIWSSYKDYGATACASMNGTVIEDNEIYGANRSGIETAGGFIGLAIKDNMIYDNKRASSSTLTPLLKYGNGIAMIRGAGDKTDNLGFGPKDVLIERNEIFGNEHHGIYMGPNNTDITITDNRIYDNGWDGVCVDLDGQYWNPTFEAQPAPNNQHANYGGSQNVIVQNNIVCDNEEYGVRVIGAPTNNFKIDALRNWWGDNTGPHHDDTNTNGQGDEVSDYVLFDPWIRTDEVTATSPTTYPFDTDGNSTNDVTLNFSTLPPGGGNVFVYRSNSFPAGMPSPPDGLIAGVYLEITSDLPNYQFNVTVTLDELPTGFGSNTMVYYYDPALGVWVPVGGTYFYDVGPPEVETFSFTTNHFTPFVFVNLPADPLVLILPDVVVNDSFDESGIPLNTYDWQQWMGNGDLTEDWTWVAQNYDVSVVPLEIATLNQTDIFGASMKLKYNPDHWELLTDLVYTGVTAGTLFTNATYTTFLDVETGSANSLYTVLADISITESANPQVQADDVNSLAIFHFRPLAASPTPIELAEAKVRTKLNQAYYVNLEDQGEYSMLLGDFVDPGATVPHAQGDGLVNLADLTVWSQSYFSDVSGVTHPGSLGHYKLKYDIGPTSTNYIDGMPEADGKIDFEDLVIFAISYGLSAHHNPKVPVQSSVVRVEAATPIARQGRLYQPILLRGEIRDVRALSLQLQMPDDVMLLDVVRGGLLEDEGFAEFMRDGNTVTLDMARLGVSMSSEGTLCMLELVGESGAQVMQALARDGRNRPIDVIAGNVALPSEVTLEGNYPNPFTPSTTILFTVPEQTVLRLDVYDQLGRRVATLFDGTAEAGLHSVQWHGLDAAGRSMPSGMYFYRLSAANTVLQRTMLLSR